MRKRPQFKAVLAWVNRQRKKMGRKPIQRMPRQGKGRLSESCPVARGLGAGCTVGIETYHTPTREGQTPACVRQFTFRFDSGQYPWLEAK